MTIPDYFNLDPPPDKFTIIDDIIYFNIDGEYWYPVPEEVIAEVQALKTEATSWEQIFKDLGIDDRTQQTLADCYDRDDVYVLIKKHNM